MTEGMKFRPEEINEAIEGLDGLRDIIAPVLRRINDVRFLCTECALLRSAQGGSIHAE